MKHFSTLIILASLLYQSVFSQEILINEVMSSNSTTISDRNGEFHDWIELFNPTDSVINLSGYYLSDDPEDPFKWQFKELLLQPQSYLLIWASGYDVQAGPMEPTKIGNLKSWFKAEDIDTTDINQIRFSEGLFKIKKWFSHDKTHNAAQTNEVRQPEFRLNRINGLPAVSFDGSNHALISNLMPPSGNSERTLMVLIANTNLETSNQNANNHILQYGAYNRNGAYGITFQRRSAGGRIGNNYWLNTFYGLAEMNNGTHTITTRYSGDADSFYFDGVFAGTNYLNLNTGTAQTLRIASRMGSWSELFGGDIAEIIVFDTALSRSDQVQVENYLAQKYGNSLQRFHTNFKLSSSGETVVLSNPDRIKIHELQVPQLSTDVSYGLKDGHPTYFSNPTPGQANIQGYTYVSNPPVFSLESGFFSDTITLTLTTPDPESIILYTLDGSTPDYNNVGGFDFQVKYNYSQCNQGDLTTRTSMTYIYKSPLVISPKYEVPNDISKIPAAYLAWNEPNSIVTKSTVVRAITWKPDAIPSKTITKTYFVDSIAKNRYQLPVVSLVVDDYHLFDYDTGIYIPGTYYDQTCTLNPPSSNYRQDEWERPTSFELFTNDGNLLFRQNAGMRIHGNFSANWKRKSIRLNAKNIYDDESLFNYELFPGLRQYKEAGGNIITTYNSFLLRNSGNNWYNNLFHDAMVHQLIRHIDGMDGQEARAVVHFINGEYWGIMNFREEHSKYYFAHHYNINPDDVIIANARTGSVSSGYQYEYSHYTNMENFVVQNSLIIEENYEYLQTQMDVENYLNHFMVEIYVNNTDFLGNNRKFWRKRTTAFIPDAPFGHDGRWRWLFYDIDQSFANPDYDRLTFTTTGNFISTQILRKLLERTDSKYWFINSFCDHMNTSFKPNRIFHVVDSMANNMAHDLQEHIERWGISSPDQNVQGIMNFANTRPYFMRLHLKNRFVLADSVLVNLQTNPSQGKIRISTITIDSNTLGLDNPAQPYPWTGIYFAGIPVEVEAIPNPGFIFSHWEGASDATEPLITIDPKGDISLIAHFIRDPAVEPELIHYWHFNNLPSGTITSVAADFSLTGNATITYPGTGAGFMDDRTHRTQDPVSNLNLHLGQQPNMGAVLRLRNPSDPRQLIIKAPTIGFDSIKIAFATTRTSSGATQQTFWYSDNGGINWNLASATYIIEELPQWGLITVNLSDIESLNNNPDAQFKIVFGGENTTITAGNNRVDNLTVKGVSITNGISEMEDLRPASVNQITGENILIFPNPATASFEINIDGTFDFETIKLEIFAADGAKMREEIVVSGRKTIQTAGWSPGIYILKFRAGDNQFVKRLVKR